MEMPLLQTLATLFPVPFKSLAERFDRSPIDNLEALERFVRTRSSYIAQTSLHGYLKTRMGTRFTEFYKDDDFSRSIRIAAIKVLTSCVADLAVYAAAKVQAEGTLDAKETAALARHLVDAVLESHLEAADFHHVPEGFSKALDDRLAATLWANAAIGEEAFAGSAKDLIRFAPVVDEFKKYDEEIVRNSIRFRWVDVRAQLKKRLEAAPLASAWRAITTS